MAKNLDFFKASAFRADQTGIAAKQFPLFYFNYFKMLSDIRNMPAL